ncbi:TNT domain-containing protein [Selenomonas ruminantium]
MYEVCKPVRSEGSIIAPWFDQPGDGIQFKLEKPINELLSEAIIREIK